MSAVIFPEAVVEQLQQDHAVELNVPLAPYTTFKVGGPATYFYRAKNVTGLQRVLEIAKEYGVPVYVLGGGSNVLIHDKGFAGLVIKMELNELTIEGNRVTVGAGMLLSVAIMKTTRAGLQGMEYAIGVPASVGGAIWANLGCRGSEIANIVETVTIIDDTNQVRTLTQAECEFTYRESLFKHKPYIVVQAVFVLTPGDPTKLKHRVLELTKLKKEEQNVGDWTAGCAFRNPTGTDKKASQLIDQLGLKGFSIGGAQVSTKHANFIVNTGDATADQIVQLVSYVKQQVRDKAGVQLLEEIEYVGF